MTAQSVVHSPFQRIPPNWAIATLLLFAGWFLTTHFLHVFSEAINWDEFALLDRASRTYRFGEIVGGGRPGLVSIGLIPFVSDCLDSARSVVNARLFWQAITLSYLLGTYLLVRRWFQRAGRPEEGRLEGVLAAALLGFIPAFVTWSVQVRTDQPALAAATWAGVMLLSTGYGSAALAGCLVAVAMLCTQKAIYVIALCGVLFVSATASRIVGSTLKPSDEVTSAAKRVATAAAVAVAIMGAYFYFVPAGANAIKEASVVSAFDTMRWYREQQGYRIYGIHASRLVVHWSLFIALIAWTVRVAVVANRKEAILVGSSWAILLLGLLVVLVHGSSFAYFWMTAGLFLSTGLAMAAGQPLALAGRMAWPVAVSLVGMAALQSAHESLEMLDDTQWEQRETMRLVFESPLRDRRGYQVEGALFCAEDPDPLPAMFSATIFRHFNGSPKAADNFVREFRNRPVAYIVESYRMYQFPDEVRQFWQDHYVWYARSLFLAGFKIDLPDEGQTEIDVIVPGKYRWEPDPVSPDSMILADVEIVRPMQSLHLRAGIQRISAPEQAVGRLILADLPHVERDAYPAFYHGRQIMQLGGRR